MRREILVLALLLPLAAASPAWAQETEQAQEAAPAQESGEAPTLQIKAESLLASLQEKIAEYDELESRLEGLEGIDHRVVQRKLVNTGLELIDDLHALADTVLELEQQGQDASAFRKPLESFMSRLPAAIERVLDKTIAGVADLRAQRDELGPGEMLDQEKKIAFETTYADSVMQKLFKHIEKMEALGLDTKPDRQFLTDNLTARADSLAERIAIAKEEIASVEARLKEAPDDLDLKLRRDAGQVRLEGIVANMGVTIKLLKKLGLETAEYQKLLIQATGDLSTDILDSKVAMSLVGQWFEDGRTWVAKNGARLAFKLLIVLLILLVFRVLANVASRVVKRSLASSRFKVSKLFEEMITSMVAKVVMLFGLLVALAQLGFSLGPLLAGLGVAGFIVGFALQDTLSNFASGLMILFYRPFDVGDMVEAGGIFGKVNRMTLVSTTLLTIDHQTLVVPNNKIWGDVIKNVTAQKTRRVDLVFGIGYGDDIPHAEKILAEILAEHPKVLDDPAPVVKLHNLGDSSVDFVVRPWVKTEDYWDVHWDVTREVKMRFDREGIGIPFPQRDVHLYQEKPASE